MKKNRLTRVLALVLMLAVAACAFAGCGKKPEELIVGKWATVIDFQKVMEAGMDKDDAEVLAEMDFSGITMNMSAEFRADGTYATEVDKESAENAMKQMIEKLVPALKEMVRKEIADGGSMDPGDVTDEMIDQMLAVFQVKSWDELGDLFVQEMDPEKAFENADFDGKYLIKDGKLYLSHDAESDPAEQEGTEFSVNARTLTLKLQGKDVPDFMKELVFKRVG